MNTELKYCVDCMSFTTRFCSLGQCVHPKNESLVDKTPEHAPEWLRRSDDSCGPSAKWFGKLKKLHPEDLVPSFDWDEYHEAIKTYRELCAGEVSILYLNKYKYIKVEEKEDET